MRIMDTFLKRTSNLIVYVVTLLGLLAIFSDQLEKEIIAIEQKFKRADELINIKKDIEAFKLLKLIKK